MKIKHYLQSNFGYSDLQVAQMKYILMTILSEVTKMIIMGVFFFVIDRLFEYIAATITLALLRRFAGGLHFNHYISCYFVTFSFMLLVVLVFPHIPMPCFLGLFLLLGCIIINYRLVPIVSSKRPEPTKELIHKSKMNTFIFLTAFTALFYIIPDNRFVIIGFWVIILQSLQLIPAKLLKTASS